MLKAGEARCAITPMNGMTVLGYLSRNGKETVRSRTISQERTRAVAGPQSARSIVAEIILGSGGAFEFRFRNLMERRGVPSVEERQSWCVPSPGLDLCSRPARTQQQRADGTRV